MKFGYIQMYERFILKVGFPLQNQIWLPSYMCTCYACELENFKEKKKHVKFDFFHYQTFGCKIKVHKGHQHICKKTDSLQPFEKIMISNFMLLLVFLFVCCVLCLFLLKSIVSSNDLVKNEQTTSTLLCCRI